MLQDVDLDKFGTFSYIYKIKIDRDQLIAISIKSLSSNETKLF